MNEYDIRMSALSFAREDARHEGHLDDANFVLERAALYLKFMEKGSE